MTVAKLTSFNKTFFIIVACFFILNAILIGIEEKNMLAGIIDIGNKLIYSSQQLSDASNQIYNENIVIDDYFSMIKTYWNVISSFLSVLLWIRIFTWITNGILRLPKLFNFIIGVMMFILIQMIVLLILLDGDKMIIAITPIMCIWHFIRILPLMMNPIRESIMNLIG